MGGIHVTCEAVDTYGNSSRRHGYDRKDSIRVDLEVI